MSFKLTKEEKLAVFMDVRNRIVDGTSPDNIGKAIVSCIEEHLSEKEELAYGEESPIVGKGAKGGGFRRTE